jgi:hypothetical protein
MPVSTYARGAAHAIDPHKDSDPKLGPVAVTATPAEQSCPRSCALWDACYYRKGLHLGRVNRDLERRSKNATPEEVAEAEAIAISRLSGRHPLRLHVGGDSTTPDAVRILRRATDRYRRRNGQYIWTYTHAWAWLPRALWGTTSVLASVETLGDAAAAMAAGYAAAVTVERHPGARAWMAGDIRVIPCPEQTRGISCYDCRLCWDDGALLRRRAVIAFAMHGAGREAATTGRLAAKPFNRGEHFRAGRRTLTIGGETLSIQEWSRRTGHPVTRIATRKMRGATDEEAVLTPCAPPPAQRPAPAPDSGPVDEDRIAALWRRVKRRRR